MARNTVAQQFRDTATDEQWKELVADHTTLSKEEFEAKYNFSWNAVMNDAANKGFYEKRERATTTAPLRKDDGTRIFFVDDIPADTKSVSRSVQLNEDIVARLQKLEADKSQYTKKSILNQLLSDALSEYGY